MKIATWNINSIRRRLPQLVDWLARNRPDVMCLQETKVQDSNFPADALRDAGYQVRFRGEKSYNGVAALTRAEPESVLYGFHDGPDNEDVRVIQVVVGGITVVNTYVPQGFKVGSEKYAYKLEWFRQVRAYFEERLDPARPVIWTGDMNVAPEPIDVYHPEKRANDPDFHIASRDGFKHAAAWGFTDIFRKLHPERVQYTYWDYFRNAFTNNWGWRIDHIMVTAPLVEKCRACDVDVEMRRSPEASDHTVVWADFE